MCEAKIPCLTISLANIHVCMVTLLEKNILLNFCQHPDGFLGPNTMQTRQVRETVLRTGMVFTHPPPY